MEEVTRTPAAPPPLTLGESLAHVSRASRWTTAVFDQICFPVGFTWFLVAAYRSGYSPAFFTSVPWRLPLLLSWSAYMSLFFVVKSYAELFLPRTPLDVVEKIDGVWWFGVSMGAIGFMVNGVLATEVHDTRVLVGCTCVAAAFIGTLVALWVWLARTYGGSSDDNDESDNSKPNEVFQLC